MEFVRKSVQIKEGVPAVDSSYPNFLQERRVCGLVAIGDEVFLLGGETADSLRISSIERYDCIKRKWIPWGNMPPQAGVSRMGMVLQGTECDPMVMCVGGVRVNNECAEGVHV